MSRFHFVANWAVSIPDCETTSFTVYRIHVCYDTLEWDVFYRYSVINRFHQHMLERFSLRGPALPKFPPKKLFGASNPAFVEQRRRELQAYLQAICRSPAFYCVNLVKFLDPENKSINSKGFFLPLPPRGTMYPSSMTLMNGLQFFPVPLIDGVHSGLRYLDEIRTIVQASTTERKLAILDEQRIRMESTVDQLRREVELLKSILADDRIRLSQPKLYEYIVLAFECGRRGLEWAINAERKVMESIDDDMVAFVAQTMHSPAPISSSIIKPVDDEEPLRHRADDEDGRFAAPPPVPYHLPTPPATAGGANATPVYSGGAHGGAPAMPVYAGVVPSDAAVSRDGRVFAGHYAPPPTAPHQLHLVTPLAPPQYHLHGVAPSLPPPHVIDRDVEGEEEEEDVPLHRSNAAYVPPPHTHSPFQTIGPSTSGASARHSPSPVPPSSTSTASLLSSAPPPPAEALGGAHSAHAPVSTAMGEQERVFLFPTAPSGPLRTPDTRHDDEEQEEDGGVGKNPQMLLESSSRSIGASDSSPGAVLVPPQAPESEESCEEETIGGIQEEGEEEEEEGNEGEEGEEANEEVAMEVEDEDNPFMRILRDGARETSGDGNDGGVETDGHPPIATMGIGEKLKHYETEAESVVLRAVEGALDQSEVENQFASLRSAIVRDGANWTSGMDELGATQLNTRIGQIVAYIDENKELVKTLGKMYGEERIARFEEQMYQLLAEVDAQGEDVEENTSFHRRIVKLMKEMAFCHQVFRKKNEKEHLLNRLEDLQENIADFEYAYLNKHTVTLNMEDRARKALNEKTFREAEQRMQSVASEFGFDDL